MGFRDLFKVRKPGNGSKFEGRVSAASKKSVAEKVPTKNNTFNSKGRKVVK